MAGNRFVIRIGPVLASVADDWIGIDVAVHSTIGFPPSKLSVNSIVASVADTAVAFPIVGASGTIDGIEIVLDDEIELEPIPTLFSHATVKL